MAFGHMHWNRRELSLKERSLERSERFEPYARWRRNFDGGGLHGFVHEGLHGDFCASGNGKQGGWNQHMEEPGQGYMPTWSGNEMLTDESCQRQVPYIDGRSYRGGGQLAKQRDPRGAGFGVERSSFSNVTQGLLDKACNKRSIGESRSYPRMTPVGCTNKSSSYYLQRKDHLGKVLGSGGLNTGQNFKKAYVLKHSSDKLGREMLACTSQKNKSLSRQSHLMEQPHRTAGASGLSSDHEYDKTSVSTDCSEREIGEVISCNQRSLVDSANNFLCPQSDHQGEMTGANAVRIERECNKPLSSSDCREKSSSKTSSYACRAEVDHEKKSRSPQPDLKKELIELPRDVELVSGQDYKSTLGSTDWKPFKRTRCGFSSGCLKFVHPGTSESTRDSDSSERIDPSFRGVKLPVQDAAEVVVSDVPSERLPSRKRQRLGWGEGLAKYEKKKVESPSGSLYFSSVKLTQPGERVTDKRLVPAIFSDCSPPATHFTSKDSEANCWTTLRACKGYPNSIGDSIYYGSQNQQKDLSISREKWDLTSILQFDIPCSGDSGSDGYPAIDKLIGSKANVLKELETTVSEIDSLEIELKSYVAGDGNSHIEEAKEMCKDIEDMVADNPFATASKLANPSSAENIQVEYLKVIESPDQAGEVGQISAAGGPSGEKTNMSLFHVDGIGAECDSDDIYKVSSGYSCTESILYLSILSSNKQAAKCASEEFNGLLPKDHWRVENSISGIFSCWHNDLSIKQKLVEKKKFRKFKEMVLTIKFKILHCLWREELLLSSRDSKRKSPEKFKSSIRIRHSEYQKWRSFLRSGFPSLGNLSIAQLQDIIDYANDLTREFDWKICRKTLQMPALILDKKERTASMFISSNGFVEDPCEVEKERAMINLWTLEEKETFLHGLAIFGKDFNKIASFLVHKTAGDCVQFYYKHHKSDWFQSSMEKLDFTTQSKAVSLHDNLSIPLKKRKHHEAVSGLIGAVPYDKDADGKKSDCKASAGHGEGCQALSLRICDPGKKMHLVPDGQDEEEENTLSEGSEKRVRFSWTDEEKALFIEALSTYGKDFAMISNCVGTKSSEECIIFFSKARSCLGLDQIDNSTRDMQPYINYDSNGGSDSVITSAAVSEMNQDFMMQVNTNKFDSLRAINSPTNLTLSDEKSVVEHLSESISSNTSAASINNARTGIVRSREVIDSKADSMESSSMFSFETNMGLAIGSQNKLAQWSGIPVVRSSCWQEEPYCTETVDRTGVRFAAQDFRMESWGSSAADTSVCSLHRFNPETSLQAPNNTGDFERTSDIALQQGTHPVRESAKIQRVIAKDEDTSSRRDLRIKHKSGHGFVPAIQSSEIPKVYISQKSTVAQELTDGGSTDPSTLQSWPINRCSTSSPTAEHLSIPKTLQKGLVCRNEPVRFKLFGRILTLPPQPSQPKFDLNTSGYDLPAAQDPMPCNSPSLLEIHQGDTGINQDKDYSLDLQLGSLPRYAMLRVNDGCINHKMTTFPGMANTNGLTDYGLF